MSDQHGKPTSTSCLNTTFTSGEGMVHRVRYSFTKGSQISEGPLFTPRSGLLFSVGRVRKRTRVKRLLVVRPVLRSRLTDLLEEEDRLATAAKAGEPVSSIAFQKRFVKAPVVFLSHIRVKC